MNRLPRDATTSTQRVPRTRGDEPLHVLFFELGY